MRLVRAVSPGVGFHRSERNGQTTRRSIVEGDQMNDETNEPQVNGEVTRDWPGTLTAADDWENVWPKSHKVWRVSTTFDVVGHTEGQARERFGYFEDALINLFAAGYDAHPLIRYVLPGSASQSIEHSVVFGHEEINHEFPRSMMDDLNHYWDWWNPNATPDLNADELGELMDIRHAIEDGAAERLRRVEHYLRAQSTFGNPLDAQYLLGMVTGASDDAADGDGGGEGDAGG